MQEALAVYFDGEKHAGLVLTGIAVAVMIAAIVMFRAGAGFRSFALTLTIAALAEIALGVGLYLRTGPQVRRLEQQFLSAPAQYYREEGARMARVQRTFVVVEYIELFVIVATAVAAVFLKTRSSITGVALGLLITAAVLLAFDLFAERRGAKYVAAIASGGRSG
jgi:hypothetical protein